mmetsp:Transcript_12819/g.38716  ORF Transcript_12819/g.38716 Transcript_12819/m.38716 type:complete len:208 (-) Transcript_12819:1048-1671(-)
MPAAVRFSTMVVVPAIPGLLSMPATAGRTATATPASLPHRFCSPLVVTASIMVRGRPGRASPPVSIWAPATVPAPAPASFTTVSIVLPTAALAGCSGVASGWRGPRGSWTDCARWGRLLPTVLFLLLLFLLLLALFLFLLLLLLFFVFMPYRRGPRRTPGRWQGFGLLHDAEYGRAHPWLCTATTTATTTSSPYIHRQPLPERDRER